MTSGQRHEYCVEVLKRVCTHGIEDPARDPFGFKSCCSANVTPVLKWKKTKDLVMEPDLKICDVINDQQDRKTRRRT